MVGVVMIMVGGVGASDEEVSVDLLMGRFITLITKLVDTISLLYKSRMLCSVQQKEVLLTNLI